MSTSSSVHTVVEDSCGGTSGVSTNPSATSRLFTAAMTSREFITRSLVLMRGSTSCRRPIHVGARCSATVMLAAKVNSLSAGAARACAPVHRVLRLWSASRAHSTTSVPSWVSFEPVVARESSGNPRRRSRVFTARVALDWAMPTERAPALRLPWSAMPTSRASEDICIQCSIPGIRPAALSISTSYVRDGQPVPTRDGPGVKTS